MRRAAFTTFLVLLTIIVLLMPSCIDEPDMIPDPFEDSPVGMSSLIIPEGFNFNNTFNASLKIKTDLSKELIDKNINYLLFQEFEGKSELIKKGTFNPSEGLSYDLELANHITSLSITTDFMGSTINHKIGLIGMENYSIPENQLYSLDESLDITGTVNSDYVTFGTEDDDSGDSGSTCNSTSNQIEYNKYFENKDFKVKANNIIEYITVNSNSGLDQITTPYKNENSGMTWKFQNETFPQALLDIKGIYVKETCKTDSSYVTNPYYATVDTDGDGVDDDSDIAPNDPLISLVTYYPSSTGFNTYAFEDKWPEKGDYDFNDLVIYSRFAYYTNANDKVAKVEYVNQIAAIGAGFDNDLVMSFEDPSSNSSITQEDANNVVVQEESGSGETKFVFKNIKDIYQANSFVNTEISKTKLDVITLSGYFTFDGTSSIA